MKKVGFIGAYDKTSLLLNIAKMLTLMNHKVLIIDSTINQKAKYVVPAISPSMSYITNFEDIDIAVGLYSFEDVTRYLGITSFEESEYTDVLIDIDNPDMITSFEICGPNVNYFVTAFDVYSLKKGVEILSGIRIPIPLTKILFSSNTLKSDDEYLNYLSLGLRVTWAENRIYFPTTNEDRERIIENEKVSKINIKDLSREYKQSLAYIVQKVSGATDNDVRRALKQLEKTNNGGAKWQ